MTTHYLNFQNSCIGFLNQVYQKIFQKTEGSVQSDTANQPDNFRILKNKYLSTLRVEILKPHFAVKKYRYTGHDITYQHLYNEASVLQLFDGCQEKIGNITVKLSKLISFADSHKQICLKTDFEKGRTLNLFTSKQMTNALISVNEFFGKLSQNSNKTTRIPKRTWYHMALLYPVFFFLSIMKYPRLRIQLFSLHKKGINSFFKSKIWKQPCLTLAHRDLHALNVLVNKASISVIDPGLLVRSYAQTDLAILPIYYISMISKSDMLRLLNRFIHTNFDVQSYTVLQIYYCMELLATLPGNFSTTDTAITYVASHALPLLNSIAMMQLS